MPTTVRNNNRLKHNREMPTQFVTFITNIYLLTLRFLSTLKAVVPFSLEYSSSGELCDSTSSLTSSLSLSSSSKLLSLSASKSDSMSPTSSQPPPKSALKHVDRSGLESISTDISAVTLKSPVDNDRLLPCSKKKGNHLNPDLARHFYVEFFFKYNFQIYCCISL